jgi:hypothetical protein
VNFIKSDARRRLVDESSAACRVLNARKYTHDSLVRGYGLALCGSIQRPEVDHGTHGKSSTKLRAAKNLETD